MTPSPIASSAEARRMGQLLIDASPEARENICSVMRNVIDRSIREISERAEVEDWKGVDTSLKNAVFAKEISDVLCRS